MFAVICIKCVTNKNLQYKKFLKDVSKQEALLRRERNSQGVQLSTNGWQSVRHVQERRNKIYGFLRGRICKVLTYIGKMMEGPTHKVQIKPPSE